MPSEKQFDRRTWTQRDASDPRRANLSRANLSGASLSKADLSGANLFEASLVTADIQGANFFEANLSRANLAGLDFHEVNLAEADLSGANLSKASLTKANLSGANLSKADLSRADLSGLACPQANLVNANLSGAILADSFFPKSDLSGANFSGADLSGAGLALANLSKANLSKADLSGAHISSANLPGSDLSGANLAGANLSEADFSGANLSTALLARADLTEADFSEANLSGANFFQAILRLAWFEPSLQREVLDPRKNTDAKAESGASSDSSSGKSPRPTLPDLDDIATATGLDQLRYRDSDTALKRLQGWFTKAGYETQAAEVKRSLRRSTDRYKMNSGEPWKVLDGALGLGLLYMTCDYGGQPFWALVWLWIFIVTFGAGYAWALGRRSAKKSGIIAKWECGRHSGRTVRVSAGFFIRFPGKYARVATMLAVLAVVSVGLWFTASRWIPLGHATALGVVSAWFVFLLAALSPRFLSAVAGGLWFSTVNTLRIGFRALSLGTWLTRMQPRPYVLEATGKMRIVAGIQSVIGLYLLVILLVTYFQPLFE